MSDVQENVTVIDANNVRESGEAFRTIELTAQEQADAVRVIGERMSAMMHTGTPVENVVKAAQLSMIGSAINISLLASVADARAFIESCLLPTLDKLGQHEDAIHDEAELMAAEPQGNA